MKILVTGGTGDVGRAAVAQLVSNGHQVTVIGRRAGIAVDGAQYRACDVTDFESLREQAKGMEGIVHLAAIRHPSLAPGQEIFRVNCTGTYNVFSAAADVGIKRIVSASSINAFGYNFGVKGFDLRYFPIDEEHPGYTTDPYSFSKQILEEIGAYFWRRAGISSICLRLPAVYEMANERRGGLVEFVLHSRTAHSALLALPDTEREERVRGIIARFERLRAERAWEHPVERLGMDLPDAGMMFGRSNFWASINALDCAQAIEQGLLAQYSGSYPLYINDSRNFVGIESEALVRLFFPLVRGRRHPLKGTESLVSINRAQALIGFEPKHSIAGQFDQFS